MMKWTSRILLSLAIAIMICGAMAVAQQSLGDAAREARAEKQAVPRVSPGTTTPADADLQPARVIHRVAPAYPPEAKDRRMYGTVVVEAMVDKQGNVGGASAINGPKVFWDSAVTAIKAFKFEPAKLKGEPIEQKVQIRFNYNPDQIAKAR
jgi:periplasmic protein TonB